MKRVGYLLLAVFLGIIAYIFYNQTTLTTTVAKTLEMPNGAIIIMQPESKIKYNKLLFSIANNMYVEGEVFINVPDDIGLGVHTLNGSASTVGNTSFLINATEKTLSVRNYEGTLDVSSYELEELIVAGEAVETVKEKAKKVKINLNTKPSWVR